MGLFRKLTSLSTLGAVDFKSDKERIALTPSIPLRRSKLRRRNSRKRAKQADL